MEGTMKSVILQAYGKNPTVKETPIPELKDGQALVKVQGSTINPSDRLFIQGQYFKRELPTCCGLEGTGKVTKVQGEGLKHLEGKRICFASQGTWTQYVVLTKHSIHFIIDEDVPLASAASGIVNPLTVLGFVNIFQKNKKNGIIHTAAASSLGRQLNKICISKGIPLLNIVRRKEQVEILKSQGATHIINTSDQDWVDQLKTSIKERKFDCLFDAIGGGQVSNQIFANLLPTSKTHIYGGLAGKPLQISPTLLLSGLKIEGFLLFGWFMTTSQAEREEIAKNYSSYLKKQLSTTTHKEFPLSKIEEAIEQAASNAGSGKVLLKLSD